MKEVRILGIDPGSQNLGIGCIEKSGNTLKLIYGETLTAPRSDSFHRRLYAIHLSFSRLLEKLSPDEVAIEDIFYAKNIRSAFHLGMARGAIITTCVAGNLPVYEYQPTRVKSVVAGSGHADKLQIQKMVGLTLGTHEKWPLDTSDALAIAICHAHSRAIPREGVINDVRIR